MLTKLQPSLVQIFPQLGESSRLQVGQVGRGVIRGGPDTGLSVSVVWMADFDIVCDQAWVQIVSPIQRELNAN